MLAVLTKHPSWVPLHRLFKLGDPTTASPPLTTASLDPSFTNINGSICTQLAWSQLGRMGPGDCNGACSGSVPGCLAWQSASVAGQGGLPARGCFIHDGTLGDSPTCHEDPNIDPEIGPAAGGIRASVPPPVHKRTGVNWKTPGYDDSSWTHVDIPHDFIIGGDGENTDSPDYPYSIAADSHHGHIPRDKAGW